MLTNSAKILLIIAVAALVCSPSKPASAETDGTASYGPFYCVRHGYNDSTTCRDVYTNNNSDFQAYSATITAEGQGYGRTSEIRIDACISTSRNMSGVCSQIYNNSDYPDSCPDPDDNCDVWQHLASETIEVDTQDVAPYQYVTLEIHVQDAAARVYVEVEGRKVAASLSAAPNPVYSGDLIQVNWNTEHAYGGVFLGHGGQITQGDNVIFARNSGCCEENSGAFYFTAGDPGTAWFELAASGPSGSGLQEIVEKVEITVLPRPGNSEANISRIVVSSNISTNWVISGRENFFGSGIYASYLALPSNSDYFISVPKLSGYKSPTVDPGFNQTLQEGRTIFFNVHYEEEVQGSDSESGGSTPEKPYGSGEGSGSLRLHRIEICLKGQSPNPLCPDVYFAPVGEHVEFSSWLYKGNGWVEITDITGWMVCNDNPPCYGTYAGYPFYNSDVQYPRNIVFLKTHREFGSPPSGVPINASYAGEGDQVGLRPIQPVPKGRIVVNSNAPTSWTIKGPENFSGTGAFGNYEAETGVYQITDVPDKLTIENQTYNLVSTTPNSGTVTENGTLTFQISYLIPPKITTASNNTCEQIKLAWNGTENATGYVIYRSEQENNGDHTKYSEVASLAPNIFSYVDTPATMKSFYYIVAAKTASSVLYSQPMHSSFNTPCSANIEAAIAITAVNDNANFDFNKIKHGDKVKIQILVDNTGPADGYITKVLEQLSPTLINPRNLQVAGPGANLGNPSISGSHPTVTLNVSGKKDVGGMKWAITFDATVDLTNHAYTDEFSTCATIFYFDDQGNKTKRTCMNEILAKNPNTGGVDFKEVAPQ